MFVVANLLQAISVILAQAARLYGIVVFVAILLQWVNADRSNPIVVVLRALTDPVFAWIRRKMPFVVVGMLDLSPLMIFVGISLIQMFIVPTLYEMAMRLR